MDFIRTKNETYVSSWSVIKIILILLFFGFLFMIRDVLAIVFVSLIFAASLDPWVDWLQKFKIPRSLSVIAFYIVIFAFITLVIYLLIPPIVQELSAISQSFPFFFEKVSSGFTTIEGLSDESDITQEIQQSIGSIQTALIKATKGVFGAIVGIFGGIISFFVILVMTFYITVEEEAMKRVVWSSVPSKYQDYSMNLINRMQRKIGLWLRGQLVLMVVIGAMTYIGLKIIGIKYALVLALLAGTAEFVPFLGPIIAAIPATFIAFTQGPWYAGGVIIMYFIIQQLENNIIVPKVMAKAVGLNPLIILIVILVGAKVGGIVGAILAIPVATAVSVVLKDNLTIKRQTNSHGT